MAVVSSDRRERTADRARNFGVSIAGSRCRWSGIPEPCLDLSCGVAHVLRAQCPGQPAGPSLAALGVGPEVLVGLCVGRSTAMVVGLLAVLKAGAPMYRSTQPIPPRLALHARGCQRLVLLTGENLIDRLPPSSASVICLDRDWESIDTEPRANLPGSAGLQNLAYVILHLGVDRQAERRHDPPPGPGELPELVLAGLCCPKGTERRSIRRSRSI